MKQRNAIQLLFFAFVMMFAATSCVKEGPMGLTGASGTNGSNGTNGIRDLYAFSNGMVFRKMGLMQLPVSANILETIKQNPELKGDTTGCGDNFAGGAIASLARQLKTHQKGDFDFQEALTWAIASGGFACFCLGGTYLENRTGEKLAKISELVEEYNRQIS